MGMLKLGLSETLFSKTQRGVLGLLFGNPERTYYANEIVRHARAGIGTVQRELERLAAAGLLIVSRVGNQKHYQANRESPIFSEMEAIILADGMEEFAVRVNVQRFRKCEVPMSP